MSKDGSKDNKKILPTNDLLFKKAFTSEGNEDLLKGLIKDLTGVEFKSVNPTVPYSIDNYKNIESDNIEDMRRTEVDVLAKANDGTSINIEIQVNNHDFFIERSLYYTFQAYIDNYGKVEEDAIKENKYASLSPVYGIFLTNFDLFSNEYPSLNKFSLRSDDQDRYELTEVKEMSGIKLIYFSFTNKNVNEKDNTKYLQEYFTGEELSKEAPEYLKKANNIVNYHNLTGKERKIVDTLQKHQDTWDAIISTATRQGLKEGREEERKNMILNLYKNGMDVDSIVKFTGFDKKFIEDMIEQ